MKRVERAQATVMAADAYATLGRQLAERLASEFVGSDPPRRRFHSAVLIAYLLAIPVVVMELGLAALGVYLLSGGIAIGSVVGATLCFVFVWGTVPRPRRMPRGAVAVDIPALQRSIDAAADALEVRAPAVLVTDEFDAYVNTIGIRRRSILVLGIPMVVGLTAPELAFLVAHELAHQESGDPARAWFLWFARRILIGWRVVLTPRAAIRRLGHTVVPPAAESLAQLVMGFLAGLVLAYDVLLIHPLLQDSRRAEHRADVLARRVAGTSAAADALRKLAPLYGAYDYVVMMAARHPQREDGAAAEYLERATSLGPRRIEPTENAATLDATHPPTDLRLRVVESVLESPSIRVSRGDENEIHAAFAEALPGSMRRMIEAFRVRNRL